MRYDAATVDLFGTLLHFAIEEHEPPLVESLLCLVDSSLDPDRVLDVWLAASMAERGRKPFRTVHEAVVVGAEAVRDELGLAIDPEGWATALEDLWADRPFQPGAPEALDRLREAGLQLALVTNLDDGVLARVVANRGLGRWFEVFVSSEGAQAYKPDPRPFALALDRLGVAAERAVHLGDSASEDAPGAEAAGLDFVLVERAPEGFARAVETLLRDR